MGKLKRVLPEGIWKVKNPKFKRIRGVVWFILITVVIHVTYRFWAHDLGYVPVQKWMNRFQEGLAQLVFDQSTWVDRHVLCIDPVTTNRTMVFPNGEGITITGGCSGDKQMIQLILLLLIYPGSWKLKSWVIPSGVILVHAVNVLRIVVLSVLAVWQPQWMAVAHDTILRGLFYGVIFGVWLLFEWLNSSSRSSP